MSTIAILGSGVVGVTLANGLSSVGHAVKLGNRTGHSVDGWSGETGTFSGVLQGADLAVLCVKGSVAEALVASLAVDLAGKTVMDTTNPLADTPPSEGVLAYFTGPNESLLERLQAAAPDAHFVKAFNSTGAGMMVHPKLAGGIVPTMFLAGDDPDAVAAVAGIAQSLGWEPEIVGKASSARAIEPLCMLWCVPGLLHNDWAHVFKLLRP